MTAWRFINLFFGAIGLLLWFFYTLRNKKEFGLCIAPLTYFLHVTVFYTWLILGNSDPVFLNNWSNAVRLHGLILGVGFGALYIMYGKKLWIHQ